MTLTPTQANQMLEAAKPLMKWIADNCHSHCHAEVNIGSVVLSEDVARQYTNEFIKD